MTNHHQIHQRQYPIFITLVILIFSESMFLQYLEGSLNPLKRNNWPWFPFPKAYYQSCNGQQSFFSCPSDPVGTAAGLTKRLFAYNICSPRKIVLATGSIQYILCSTAHYEPNQKQSICFPSTTDRCGLSFKFEKISCFQYNGRKILRTWGTMHRPRRRPRWPP